MTVTHSIGENELRDRAADDLEKLANEHRDCSVCDGDGIKMNGSKCGGCDGTGKFPKYGLPDADKSPRAIMLRAVSELRRSAGLGTVSVKPLEWSEWGNGWFIARANDLLEYSIAKGHQHWRLYVGKHQYIDAFDSAEAAFAAAQSDFETRVKSCLTSIGVEAGKCDGQLCYYHGCQHLDGCVQRNAAPEASS